MKKQVLILMLFLSFTSVTQAQDNSTKKCKSICQVEKTVYGGTFLGLEIQSLIHGEGDVKVIDVFEGTQAEKMGIQVGDILKDLNGVKLVHMRQTIDYIQRQRVGQPIKLTVLRNGQSKILRGELGYRNTEKVMETVCCDEVSEELTLEKVAVFPNPSSGQFNLSFKGNDEPYNIQILDLKGNLVFAQNVTPAAQKVNEHISTAITTAGEYVLVIMQNGKIHRENLVVIK